MVELQMLGTGTAANCTQMLLILDILIHGKDTLAHLGPGFARPGVEQ